LAVYDGAEVALKPVFGSLADRVGARPVLLGGLLAFAAASAAFVIAGNPAWVGLARFGQGAAAAAFSPGPPGVLVSRLTPQGGQGSRLRPLRPPGKAWAIHPGPATGRGVLIAAGGYPLLFATLAVLGVAVRRLGGVVLVPAVTPLPRARQTVADLARRLTSPGSCDQTPGAGRRHRSPVGRRGVPARSRGQPGPGAAGDRRDRVTAGRSRRPSPAARRTRPRPGPLRRPHRPGHRACADRCGQRRRGDTGRRGDWSPPPS